MQEIKFDSRNFATLGFHYSAQSWSYQELLGLLDEYMDQSQDITNLFNLATALEAEADTKVLSTYQGKDKNTYFDLPKIMKNSEGELCLIVGDLQSMLTFSNKTYTTKDYSFKVVTRRKDPKDSKSEITGIQFIATVTQDVDGLEEEMSLVIPLQYDRQANPTEIVKALQSGQDHEAIKQIGVGGSIQPSYKPYMLPRGFYKISSVDEPYFFPEGGKAWRGEVSKIDSGDTYKVSMNTAPFIQNQQPTLLISAQRGKAVYLYIAGAYETAKGIGAIAHASILPEVDGTVSPQIWSRFVEDAKRITATTATKNAKSLLNDLQIAEKRAEFEANETARIAEWKLKKAQQEETAQPETVALATTEDQFADIPF
jgi:hypothetical protein